MPVMKQLRIGSVNYDTVGEASVTQVQTSGTKIATVTIDGTATDLYAPEGGSGGSTVTVTQTLTSGTEIASVSVDGTSTTLYAPTPPTVPSASSTTPSMDGTAAVGTATTYARADHVHPTDTSRQAALVSGTNIKTVNGKSLVGSGNVSIAALPSVSNAQNGMVLMVVNGTWMAQPLPIATAEQYGIVMVDGTTITAAGGVISTVSSESYEIAIALTNPISGSDFRRCDIYYFDGNEAVSPPISTLDSPSGSTTVNFDAAQYQQLALGFDTNWGSSFTEDPVCTGDVTFAGYDARTGSIPIFNVAGSGSITIDSIDYGD